MNRQIIPVGQCRRILARILVSASLLVTVVRHGDAASLPQVLEPGGEAQVVEVVDGDTVRLDDGRQVRMTGIQAPKLPLGRKGFHKWPLADEAKIALERISLQRRVLLGYGGRQMDRHGRVLAQLYTTGGIWLQGRMVELGLARVYSFADNRTCALDLLNLEREARTARRGIWHLDWYAVRDADGLDRRIGNFELVEGTVRQVAVVRSTLYLNFGDDWRQDFTVSASGKVRRLLEREDFDYRALQGRRIRVRGWLDLHNGPEIRLSHPEQIEVLPEMPLPASGCLPGPSDDG